MASERDRDLVAAIRDGSATGVVVAEAAHSVAAELSQDPSAVIVGVADLSPATAAARVRVAELLVERARQAEDQRGVAHAGRPVEEGADGDGRAADRQAVRFALVILLLALPAGLAVYLADGLVLAPAAPAAALVGLGLVVLVHRRRPADHVTAEALEVAVPGPRPDVERTPAVRAAQAHLRRQQAAWKVVWWERDRPVPDIDRWAVRIPDAVPVTLVTVDAEAVLDHAAVATMTATAPAAVRVVVLQAR